MEARGLVVLLAGPLPATDSPPLGDAVPAAPVPGGVDVDGPLADSRGAASMLLLLPRLLPASCDARFSCVDGKNQT